MELTQEEKAARLQHAVINSPVEELLKVCDELGDVEMTAPALGLACRFRGLEVVKRLVEKGATFDFPSTKEIEETYNCYIGRHHRVYRTNYSIYLLKVFGEKQKIFCLKGMTMEQAAQKEDGGELPFLADEERVKVLRFLMENRVKIAFDPEEMLYYAIYSCDMDIVKELRAQGVHISEIRVDILTNGATAMNGYWLEYTLLTERLADEDYLEVMQQLASDLDGKRFHYTENIYAITRRRFRDFRIFEFFFSYFKKEKMNKREIMRGLVDEDVLEAFPLVEREGWLGMSKRRDEMIAYASGKGRTEILAWLLDYKKRTADFAAEQEKAEKKMMRELNMAPDSVTALKKIWSYRKREDGTLVITNYKGSETIVAVPEKIGKDVVATIGDGAFEGRCSGFNSKVRYEQRQQHSAITKITLPETIQCIGLGAFYGMMALEEINLPEKITVIGKEAFSGCGLLKNITLPEQLKQVEEHTFWQCGSLESILFHEGLEQIGESAFVKCSSLKKIVIPQTVEAIERHAFEDCSSLEEVEIRAGVKTVGEYAFAGCHSLGKIVIPQTVGKIKDGAFEYCRQLREVCIGAGVKEIGRYAFEWCEQLREVTIPESVEKVGSYAFAFCDRLEAVHIGAGVKEIGAYAFQRCVALKHITIPASVEQIEQCAFVDCDQLEEVCICGEVTKIGSLVFLNCGRLREIRVLKSIPNRILGETFEKCPNLVVSCPKGSKTEAYCKKKGILLNQQ